MSKWKGDMDKAILPMPDFSADRARAMTAGDVVLFNYDGPATARLVTSFFAKNEGSVEVKTVLLVSDRPQCVKAMSVLCNVPARDKKKRGRKPKGGE
ncbi:MAG: hypothetical protein GY759_09115 [Chloroflexi bacterium]|nr:hypothetical protein [Chloroflexota bacterium]